MSIFRDARKSRRKKNASCGSAPPPNVRKSSPETREPAAQAAEKVPARGGKGVRVLVSGLKLLATLVAAAATIWGGVLAYRHATTSEYFALKMVKIEGARRLTSSEVMAAGKIEKGMNLFSVDVEDVARRIESHPWIQDADVTRQLPGTVTVEVLERKAEMLILFDVPYLVDDSGNIFKRWSPDDPIPTPVLSGVPREQLATDEEGVAEVTRAALSLAKRYRAAGLERLAPLSEIYREVDGGFSLTVGEDPFYVRFGKGPYRIKLARLGSLMRRMRRDSQRPAMIFFDNEVRPDRVTVKTKPPAEAGSVAANTPNI